jgi:uncharacterized protein DUF1259
MVSYHRTRARAEVVFQKLDGRRDAVTGELYVLPGEVDPVVKALDEHGLQVTAVHNHMVDDAPRMLLDPLVRDRRRPGARPRCRGRARAHEQRPTVGTGLTRAGEPVTREGAGLSPHL